MNHLTFILGGMRSGKSAHAERLANTSRRPKIYIATAQALDAEMAARIHTHQTRRGKDWTTLEIPLALADAVSAPVHAKSIILVDCLTLWLSNLMHHGLNIAHETQRLVEALHNTPAEILLVSTETGQGIIPQNPLARQFCDHAGQLHQQVAAVANRVIWVVAGIPTVIQESPHGQ